MKPTSLEHDLFLSKLRLSITKWIAAVPDVVPLHG